jgi:hypothetical protein
MPAAPRNDNFHKELSLKSMAWTAILLGDRLA